MTNVRYAPEDYRNIETVNSYRERLEAGFLHGSVMELLLSDYSDNKKKRSPEILRSYEARMYYIKKTSALLP